MGCLAWSTLFLVFAVGCHSWLPPRSGESLGSGAEQPTNTDKGTDTPDKVLGSNELRQLEDRPITVTAIDGLELKQARLWARVDELEGMVRAQKARMKLLEKGLMLGVVPEGLEEPLAKKPIVETQIEVEKLAVDGKPMKEAPLSQESVDPAAKKNDFEEKMSVAKEMFRSGHYGKAYVEFSKIDKEFAEDGGSGEQKYWLGRCWYQLKEYQTAIQSLKAFTKTNAASPWAASAKFFLAKSELDSGLREAAVKHFQEIIRDHPYEGTAEAAKQAIGNLEKAL